MNDLKFITVGTVIHISNAKIYYFHGKKQIQQQMKASFIKETTRSLTVSTNFMLGGAAGGGTGGSENRRGSRGGRGRGNRKNYNER